MMPNRAFFATPEVLPNSQRFSGECDRSWKHGNACALSLDPTCEATNMASIVATPLHLQEPQAVRFQLATSVSKTAEIYASLG